MLKRPWESRHLHPRLLYKNFSCSVNAHHWIRAIHAVSCSMDDRFEASWMPCSLRLHTLYKENKEEATNNQHMEHSHLKTNLVHLYTIGALNSALYCGPKCNRRKLRWVPAVVAKVFGTQSVNVCAFPRGPTWHGHTDQLHPCYGVEEDADPGEPPTCPTKCPNPEDGGNATNKDTRNCQPKQPTRKRWHPWLPLDDQYGLHNPRCLEWLWQEKIMTSDNPLLVRECYGNLWDCWINPQACAALWTMSLVVVLGHCVVFSHVLSHVLCHHCLVHDHIWYSLELLMS